MFRTARLAHSLGMAVAATALLGDASPALAQSSAPDPAPTTVSLFGNPTTFDTKPKSTLESWLSGFDMKCSACRGFEATSVLPVSTNLNAPWVLQGKWQRETKLGVVSTGFVGVRNYALPLSTAMPLGGEFNPATLRYAPSSVFAPSSQWSFTAAFEKTLFTSSGGATVGVTGDVLMPFHTEWLTVGDSRIAAQASPTFRFGIVFRW